MSTYEPKTLIEDFNLRFPWLYRNIESWEERRPGEILIHMNNNKLILYDNLNHFPYEIRFFDKISELSEVEWREGFSRRLAKMIRVNYILKEDLAERVGVSPVMISRYLSKSATPSSFVLAKLAEELKCSTEDFMPKEFVILNQ